VCYLVVALVVIGSTPSAWAGFVPSGSGFDRSADLESIQKVLEVKAVSERLSQLGFSSEEIQARLASMSDQEVHHLATHLDELRVGGNGVGIVVGVLIIALLVVLLIYLAQRV
jgi:hypothetical protein